MTNRVSVEPRVSPLELHNKTRFSEFKRKALKFWHRSQIGHRSQYSVERFLAFRDYHERTSTIRVVAVCLFTPIPALSVALAIDCIPLLPPSDGWKANYALWVRLVASMFFVTTGLVLQVKEVIVAGTISNTGAFGIALGSAIAYVAVSIAVATWKFPIPFGYVLMVGPYVVIFSIATVLVIGRSVLATSSVLQKQIKSQLLIITTQGLVAVAYPAFSAVFNQLSGFQQTLFVFVMPLIKFVTKQNIANTARHLHEYLGPIVVFSVDVFNVFYVAICMQAATSTITTLIIISSDSFHMVLALRAIFRHADIVQARHDPSALDTPAQSPTIFLRDLPGVINTAFHVAENGRSHTSSIRMRAPFPLPLSDESKAILDELMNVDAFCSTPAVQVQLEYVGKPQTDAQCSKMQFSSGTSEGRTKSTTSRSFRAGWQHFRVAPARRITQFQTKVLKTCALNSKKGKHLHRMMTSANESPQTSEEAVRDALQTLFHSEYVLMAEYIEFMLPMLYALYLAAVFHLPVAAYYPHTQSMTTQKLKASVTSILIFSAIEFAAFVVLLILLKRKFGFSPLYQLAFVLEMQFCAVQGHLFVWNIYILHLTLVHYGVDFNAPFTSKQN